MNVASLVLRDVTKDGLGEGEGEGNTMMIESLFVFLCMSPHMVIFETNDSFYKTRNCHLYFLADDTVNFKSYLHAVRVFNAANIISRIYTYEFLFINNFNVTDMTFLNPSGERSF
jgi:hypothetical protein